jgi:general secretion pathway protein M
MSTLRERLDKLEPRERRLLTIFGGFMGALLVFVLPLGLTRMVSTQRSENQEVRDLLSSVYEAEGRLAERKAQKEAVRARYAKAAPALAGYLEETAKKQGLSASESQERPDVPHGKRYTEKVTVVKMNKIGMLPLAKMLEQIETSGYPLSISKLNLKPRAGEPDSYQVELGVSAFERKPDPSAAAGAGSAQPGAGDAAAEGESEQ